MSRVGEKIKNIRIESKMTQKQLGKKLGVSEKFISDVETGKKIINQNLIDRISKIFGKDLNDIVMNFHEDLSSKNNFNKNEFIEKNNSKNQISEVWKDALGDIIKGVPVYKYDLKKVLYTKPMPIINNKINGYNKDKVIYIQIEDDDMIGFRICKGDIAFAHLTNEINNNSIYLMEQDGKNIIRQVKKIDSNKALVISNRGNILTKTVQIKDLKLIAKLDTLEINL
ncbi:anaerobic benzoate catabolism transcriptional regulator [Clostridium acetireducens DSM 10703]|jgi:transcriptional regulator with XRE-family HTH domain|uniref:Anaerobic benzoate catabolism transcriptional regulator n=1 Tax=Clostridium acetireducens DSM 10703 TaxID=1121290 RepID=A0A1E8EZK8_9CLOT|nr:helix-turn-helix domain-containing protein [Clostridium acetireducens]OFI06593.1 anaerobic benzoate catabolism transcriptional regulator [Clostridium acetireducens DSM 10703]